MAKKRTRSGQTTIRRKSRIRYIARGRNGRVVMDPSWFRMVKILTNRSSEWEECDGGGHGRSLADGLSAIWRRYLSRNRTDRSAL